MTKLFSALHAAVYVGIWYDNLWFNICRHHSGGSKGGGRASLAPPSSGQFFFHFHAVFRKNWLNGMLAPPPPHGVGAPLSRKSWIRHCIIRPYPGGVLQFMVNKFIHNYQLLSSIFRKTVDAFVDIPNISYF